MELHPLQQEAVDKLTPLQRGIVYHEMGEGKSRIAIAIYDNLKPIPPSLCLIVCRRKAFDTWRDEITKCGFDAMVQEYPSKLTGISKRRPTVWLVSHAMLHKLLNEFKNQTIDFVVYDELYLYSNHKSKRSVAAQHLTKCVDGRCIGLSGTIMPARDTLAIWGQAMVCGLSEVIARTTTDFYSIFKKSFLVDYGRGQIRQWQDMPYAKEQLLTRLAPYIHVNFPKSKRSIVESFTEFDLTKQQLNAIKTLKEDYFLQFEETGFEIELRSALDVIIKVSQVSNGWIKDKSGQMVRFPSKKLDALCARLEEAHATGQQLLVWCHFRTDIEVIRESLDFPILEMSGGKDFDRDGWRNRVSPIVLATMGSGASVNDFKNVSQAIYFSQSFKHLDFVQSKARTNRYDSAHASCHYQFLLSRGTFDQHIYNILKKTAATEKDFIDRSIVKQWLLS